MLHPEPGNGVIISDTRLQKYYPVYCLLFIVEIYSIVQRKNMGQICLDITMPDICPTLFFCAMPVELNNIPERSVLAERYDKSHDYKSVQQKNQRKE